MYLSYKNNLREQNGSGWMLPNTRHAALVHVQTALEQEDASLLRERKLHGAPSYLQELRLPIEQAPEPPRLQNVHGDRISADR